MSKGRTPEELARQFEPSAQAIRNWVKRAALDAGERTDGLTTEERDELRRLRREVRQLREERAICQKPRLVCTGDQYDPVQGFEFVTAHHIRPGTNRQGPLAPRVVPAGGDTQDAAHGGDRMDGLLYGRWSASGRG